MGDEIAPAEPVNKETLELLERRISDRIVEQVRPRLFRFYAAIGSAVIAVLAGLGINVYVEFKGLAERTAKQAIAPTAERAVAAEQKYQMQYEVFAKLLDRATTQTFDKLETTLAAVAPKSKQLDDFTSQVSQLDEKMRAIGSAAAEAAQNTDRLVQLSQKLSELADRAGDLSKLIRADNQASPAASPAEKPNLASAQQIVDDLKQIASSSKEFGEQIKSDQKRSTVWFQFYGIPRDKADAMALMLRKDFLLPGIEQTPSANNGRFEVRYFWDKDKDMADRLSTLASEAAKVVLGDARTAEAANFTSFPGTKPKVGTVELWHSPRRTYSSQ